MYLEELIENVELESDKFECKSRLNREDVVGWLKSIDLPMLPVEIFI